MPSLEQLLAQVGSHRDEMVEALCELIRIPAIGPESGGSGELERSRYLRDILDRSKFEDIEMYDALDERVRMRFRPNIVAKRRGEMRADGMDRGPHGHGAPRGPERMGHAPVLSPAR